MRIGADAVVEFGLLGTLEVRAGDELLSLGRPKQRALLALLLLHPSQTLSRERLIDGLWGESPPETAANAVKTYVSQLRKLLPEHMLLTRPPGYILEVAPETIDLGRFEQLVAAARGADTDRASSLLAQALALWRGAPLAEFVDEPFARVEARRLEGLRLAALEERIDADLALGRHALLVGELEAVVAEHPERERPRGQLMLALYRSGRQAEALDAYRDARAALDALGLAPGAELRQLERKILTQAPSLDLARPVTPGPVPLPGALVPAPPFPFVGRANELTALRSLLERAEGGEGGFALLAAEAGGGKTRLVRELAHEAGARGRLVLYGASDATVSVPYQPLREWLEFLLRSSDPETLAECAGDEAGILSRLVPGLARHTRTPAPRHDSEADRFVLQSAAVGLLVRISRRQPLLVVADDAHWADGGTLLLLRRLASSAPESRLLVLAAYRDRGEEVRPAFSDAIAELLRLDGVTRLALGRLTEMEVHEFIRASTDADPAGGLASEIAELTGGTPLLLCELWRDVRERRAVTVSDGAVRLTQPVAELGESERLRELLRQRLSRLAPEAVAILDAAAVAGAQFELRLLAEATAHNRKALVETVAEAIRKGLLEELPESEPSCRFTHELVRRSVYDRIPRIRRAELHLHVGEALERVNAPDTTRVLPELAHHFTLAAPLGGTERAIDYGLRAAAAAIGAGAYDDAAARLSTALELGIDDPRERARVQVELAYLLRETGRVAEAEATLASSLAAVTGPEERGHAARVLVNRLHHEMWDPGVDPDHPRTLAARSLETFAELGDSRGLAETERLLAMAARRQGHVAEALDALEGALVHADECGDQSARRLATTSLAFALCDGPTPVAVAVRRCEELLAASGGDRLLEAVVSRCLSALLAMAGRFDEAVQLLDCSSLVLDTVTTTSTFVYRRAAAETKGLLGDREGAADELDSAWKWFANLRRDSPDTRAMLFAYLLALLRCDQSRWDDAERLLEYGREAPEPASYRLEAVLRLAVRARLAAHRGEPGEAVALAERAVGLAEQSDMLNLRADLWVVLAASRRAAGSTAEADAAVGEAIRLYELKGNVAAAASVRAAAT
jgi:DNA-binding SARP family transcriptional activator